MHSPDREHLPGAELLRLARASIEYGWMHNHPLPIDCDHLPSELTKLRSTFTTLRRDGELRGCCGTLEAVHPLARDVTHTAFQAAFADPRFEPLGGDELAAVRLEVAVLSPLEPLGVADEAELLQRLRPGTDGLVIVADGRRATLLPKVWDALPEPRQFVAALKAKCGLERDSWSQRYEFLRYRTTSFAEAG